LFPDTKTLLVNVFFYKTARFLEFIPLKSLIRLSGQRIIYPFYHLVSDEPVIHIRNLYPVRTVKAFEKDLDFLLKEFRPLHIRDLIDPLKRGDKPPQKGFLLSFDDGLREFHDVVAPLLLKKGIPAICFVNTAFIDNRDLFFRYKASILIESMKTGDLPEGMASRLSGWFQEHGANWEKNRDFLLSIPYKNRDWLDELAVCMEVRFNEYLKQHQPYLSSEQIAELTRQGFVFGAHSIDHPRYAELNPDQQLFQTIQSVREVTDKYGASCKLFSFPFTDFAVTRNFFDRLFKEDNPPVDLTFGGAGLKKDVFSRNIQRIPLEVEDFTARDIVYGEYLYFLSKALFGKNTIKRD